MSVFFNGRLYTTPTTASAVDDSGLANKNLTVGNVCAILGRSTGGAPLTPLRFGDPEEAKDVLRSGELLTAVLAAFNPSAQTGSPSEVIAIRVNPATPSTLVLKDAGANDSILLQSTDSGSYTAQIKAKVESGSTMGKKLTAQLGNAYYSADNIGRNAFSIQYIGVIASAAITVTGTSVVLQAPAGSPVATIDLNAFDTIEKLVDRINSQPDFSATVLDGNGTQPTLFGLDFVSSVNIKLSPVVMKADLQACVDWVNGNGEALVTATRAPNAGQPPANTPFAFLSGGSDGVITNSSWSDAFAALQGVDAQWVTPASSDPSLHAMTDAHCMFMSSVGKSERRAICGTAINTSDAAALAAAKALNSDRTSLVHIGHWDYNMDGKLVLMAPYITAAKIAGAFAGASPGTPMTNKTLKVRGLERKLRNPTDTDVLIKGGVMCVEETNEGYKVVQSISTWLVNDNYNRVEVSTGVCVDFTMRNVREAVDPLRGEKGTPVLLSRFVSKTESTLTKLAEPEPIGPGVLVGDKESPPFRNVRAALEGDVVKISYEAQPAIGVNFVLCTMYANAYSGSASI